MAARGNGSFYGAAPIRWDTAKSSAASHAREWAICGGQASRGDRAPRADGQKTADRAADRAPIQPGAGNARPHADAHRITRPLDHVSISCRDCVNAFDYSEGCKA